ncbi:hypothetical protein DVDV_1601 [Desulfovibrio sp. DV]|uniref:hypothetical protein n=1 Tax=Desulfovibrio sp. DV TaxID=1844708 RepID=UPI00094B99E7|nr:hypothetical protein [Desulfovibrio sp. DV]OLN28458.1 hypothetical protein DVDV_1601 [Desulfovibrio sp. DV]
MRQSGSSLLLVITTLLAFTCLAVTVSFLTSSSQRTSLASIHATSAYYLALSGLNYWSAGKTGTYSLADGSFTLSQSGPDGAGYYTVTSLGCVNAGTAAAANCQLSARRKSAKPINFDDDIDDFIPPVVGKTANNARSILVFDSDLPDAPGGLSDHEWATLWAENAYRYAGGWLRLGGGLSDSNGAIWYGGDYGSCQAAQCPDGTCRDGACTFGKGLRAYFVFTFQNYDDSADSMRCADGFTFTVATAANDPATAAGGPASGSRGEYLGYSGPGPSGLGIAPPKLAVEVDTYPNTGQLAPTMSNSRADASFANHIAVVYWGSSSTSYDDNTHGAGNAPGNPGKNSTGYYQRAKPASGPNWLEDGAAHAMRLEIHRTNDGTRGRYRVLAWIDPGGTGSKDVSADYSGESPLLDHTVSLAPSDHAGLASVRFGWTEGTGGETQTVAIYDFSLDFRH